LADREKLFRLRNVASGAWRKIGGDTRGGSGAGAADTVSAVVEVREPGYVPQAAHRRTAISPTLFTADVERGRLPDLENDPLVLSVELGRPLHRSD
jgi:hypothetical protein